MDAVSVWLLVVALVGGMFCVSFAVIDNTKARREATQHNRELAEALKDMEVYLTLMHFLGPNTADDGDEALAPPDPLMGEEEGE